MRKCEICGIELTEEESVKQISSELLYGFLTVCKDCKSKVLEADKEYENYKKFLNNLRDRKQKELRKKIQFNGITGYGNIF